MGPKCTQITAADLNPGQTHKNPGNNIYKDFHSPDISRHCIFADKALADLINSRIHLQILRHLKNFARITPNASAMRTLIQKDIRIICKIEFAHHRLALRTESSSLLRIRRSNFPRLEELQIITVRLFHICRQDAGKSGKNSLLKPDLVTLRTRINPAIVNIFR